VQAEARAVTRSSYSDLSRRISCLVRHCHPSTIAHSPTGALAYSASFVAWQVVIGRSGNVTFASPNEVLQVHLALTGSPSEMRVTWTTRDAKSPQV
jgi:hypothetical protein